MQPQPRRLRWSRAGNHSNHSSPGATQHCNIAIGAITAIALSFIGSRRTSLRHPLHYRRLLLCLVLSPAKIACRRLSAPLFCACSSFVEQFVRGAVRSWTGAVVIHQTAMLLIKKSKPITTRSKTFSTYSFSSLLPETSNHQQHHED